MTTPSVNLNEAREFLLKLAPKAGEILRRYFISRDFTTTSKGGVDVLTQADKEVEDFLIENIKKQFPNLPILGEETSPKDYDSFKNLDNLWVIDPLDGTVNFSRGLPNFAISIGLVDKGISKLGVVYAPMSDELYWAQQNEDKAYLNGKSIQISATLKLEEALLATGWGWDLETRPTTIHQLEKLAVLTRQIVFLGSAVADLASVAKGRIDAYFHPGLKPWDTAASSLLIEKAGGKITTPTGNKWDIFQPEMLATNGVLHSKILELLKTS